MQPRRSPLHDAWRERVVLAYIDEPPFAQPGGQAGAVGCDVELALTVLAAIGVRRVETRLTTFAELIPGVAAGRWDMNVPLFVTAQRSRVVAFSRPVWALRDGFIVDAGNPQGLRSYRDLVQSPGARLGVVSGQVQHDAALRAGVPPGRIREFETQRAALAALRAGEIHAYASTALGNRVFIGGLGDPALQAVELEGEASTVDAGPPVGAFSFALADTELRGRFDAFLMRYLGSPAHRERMAAHGLLASEIDPVLPHRL